MCNIFDMPREWAEDDKQNEADAFAEALRRMKPEDTISKLTAENAELRDIQSRYSQSRLRGSESVLQETMRTSMSEVIQCEITSRNQTE